MLGPRHPRSLATIFVLVASCGSPHELVIGRRDPAAGGSDMPIGQAGTALTGQAGSAAGSGAGGEAGSSGRGEGGSGGSFALWRREEFDVLDESVWERATHTFEENLADFVADNVAVAQGRLVLGVTQKAAGSPGKPYAAAELRTIRSFTYGRFVARARFAAPSGVVTTLFTFHDFFSLDAPATWNEIVLEGRSAALPRLHYKSSYPSPDAPSQRRVADAYITPEFDPAGDFHEYAIEWTPAYVRLAIDGVAVSELSAEPVTALRLAQRFVVSAYPSSMPWAGDFGVSALPSTAEYDWVELYTYTE